MSKNYLAFNHSKQSFTIFVTFNILATKLDKIISMCILLYLNPCGI